MTVTFELPWTFASDDGNVKACLEKIAYAIREHKATGRCGAWIAENAMISLFRTCRFMLFHGHRLCTTGVGEIDYSRARRLVALDCPTLGIKAIDEAEIAGIDKKFHAAGPFDTSIQPDWIAQKLFLMAMKRVARV
jgi:hypothetical protein